MRVSYTMPITKTMHRITKKERQREREKSHLHKAEFAIVKKKWAVENRGLKPDLFFTLIRFYPCFQGKKNVVCVTVQPIKGLAEKQRPEIPERRSMQTKPFHAAIIKGTDWHKSRLVQTAFKWEREDKKVRWWKQGNPFLLWSFVRLLSNTAGRVTLIFPDRSLWLARQGWRKEREQSLICFAQHE